MAFSDDSRGAGTWAAVLALVLVAAVACGAASAKDQKEKGPLSPTNYDPQISLAPLVDKVSRAVVNIRTKTTVRGMQGMMGPEGLFEFFFGHRPKGSDPFGGTERTLQAAGSGFIIESDGLVVTNHHVIKNVDEIEVQLADDRIFIAQVVGSDQRTDVALLRLEKASGLPTVEFGDSDALKVGDRVVAIGNPFGLDHTVTAGIVSAKERVFGAGPYDDFIQTDASINPGNSGGPLFDLSGYVIGINTAVNRNAEGIGFAIPSNLARDMIEALRNGGTVVRGWLGVVPQPLTDELAQVLGLPDKAGALVANVQVDSPAQKGGLKVRDVIVKIDGTKLKNSREIYPMIARLKPGKTVSFSVIRDGKRKTLSVKIGEMPNDDKSRDSSTGKKSVTQTPKLGIQVDDLDDNLRRRLGAGDVVGGVVVTNIEMDSPLRKVVRTGDIITEVNRDPVGDVARFREVVKEMGSGDDLLFLIYRRGAWIYQVVRL